MNPLPRYSTTRAQPPTGRDVNAIGDFLYHNNIENIGRSPESSIQVDDFYYDYNFINFHEDLDDSETDGIGAEGSRMFGVPQDAEPTQMAPTVTTDIAVIPEVTKEYLGFPLETGETANTNLDPTEDNENAGAENSKDWDDFLSEDYLLPVSPTHRPADQHSQTQEERNNRLSVPTKEVFGPDVENGLNFTADSLTDVGTTEYQTTISGIPTTPTSTPVGNDSVYVYSYYEESTLIPEDHKNFQTVQLEESASEIPQTASQTFVSPSGFILEDLDWDHSDFTTYATGGYSWDTDFNPTTASLPTSEESTPTPLPYLKTSGNQQASDNPTSSGTGTQPPTALEGATRVPPANLLPDAKKYDPTEPPRAERGGAEFSPRAPWLNLEAPDETVTPVRVTGRGSGIPSGTRASPEHVATGAPHRDPPTSTHPAVLRPLLLPTSVQTTASPQVTFSGYWITGNWSAVSSSVAQFFSELFSSSSFVFFDQGLYM